MRLPLVLVLFALAGGCASPTGSKAAEGAAEDCGAPGGAFSGNAPVLEAMRGEDVAVARRFVEAFRDAWLSDKPIDASPGARKWATRDGEVRVNAPREETLLDTVSVDYTTPHGDAFSRATVAAAFARLGADAASIAFEEKPSGGGSYHQTFEGVRLQGTGGSWNVGRGDPAPYGQWAGLTTQALRNLSDAQVNVSFEDAARVALIHDRCALDREGKTEGAGYARQGDARDDGLGIVHDSLVRLVAIRYTEPVESHCGLVRRIAVDAETGAIHGQVPFGCD